MMRIPPYSIAIGALLFAAACGEDDPVTPAGPVTLAFDELCSAFSATDIATFEDAALEDAVRETLGLSPSDDLTCGVLATLASLTAPDLGIAALGGIQNAASLEVADLSGNPITDVSILADLPDLAELDLSGVGITDLSALSSLPSIEILSLDELDVTDLSPLSGLATLTHLSVANNVIVDVSPLASLTGLLELDISSNSITNISPLSTLTALTALNIEDNETISDIGAVSSMTSLTRFESWHNSISDLTPLSGLTTLVFLDVDWNDVSDLSPLSGLVNVEHLDVGDNSYTDITPLAGMTKLVRLDLEDIGLTDIGTVSNFTVLEQFIGKGNNLTDITALQGLDQLSGVELNDNPSLTNVDPLINNAGIGLGDAINLDGTLVACPDAEALRAKGARVASACFSSPWMVEVDDNLFSPAGVTVVGGESVTWTWIGANNHNVTFASGSSSTTQSSGSFTRLFDAGGTFNYQCTIHSGMSGTVVVLED